MTLRRAARAGYRRRVLITKDLTKGSFGYGCLNEGFLDRRTILGFTDLPFRGDFAVAFLRAGIPEARMKLR